MSLILEALRKSEAERRRGQLPSLQVELPPLQASRAGLPRWLWFALVAGCIAALALVWGLRGGGRPAPAAAVAPAQSPPRAPRASPPASLPASPAVAVDGAGEAGTMATPPPALAAVPPRTAGATASRDAIRRAPAAQTNATASREPAAPDPAAVAPPSPEPPRPTLARLPASQAGPARSPPAVSRPIRADAGAAPPPLPIGLADLGADERRALPALKISMHMWNEAPAQRFVIIDGNRVTEGSRIGDAVVERITPDGVLLAWQGRQLRLPIR